MPGFEYTFNVLQFHVAVNPQDAAIGSLIERNGMSYEAFENLTRAGWRLRTATPIQRGTGAAELLVVLEREIATE